MSVQKLFYGGLPKTVEIEHCSSSVLSFFFFSQPSALNNTRSGTVKTAIDRENIFQGGPFELSLK